MVIDVVLEENEVKVLKGTLVPYRSACPPICSCSKLSEECYFFCLLTKKLGL